MLQNDTPVATKTLVNLLTWNKNRDWLTNGILADHRFSRYTPMVPRDIEASEDYHLPTLRLCVVLGILFDVDSPLNIIRGNISSRLQNTQGSYIPSADYNTHLLQERGTAFGTLPAPGLCKIIIALFLHNSKASEEEMIPITEVGPLRPNT